MHERERSNRALWWGRTTCPYCGAVHWPAECHDVSEDWFLLICPASGRLYTLEGEPMPSAVAAALPQGVI